MCEDKLIPLALNRQAGFSLEAKVLLYVLPLMNSVATTQTVQIFHVFLEMKIRFEVIFLS